MPIYDKHKIIFVHIPKTAGTTINSALGIESLFSKYKSLDDYDIAILYGNTHTYELDHLPARNIKRITDCYTWDHYFKFAVVRNPYDRMVSQYFYAIETEDYRMIGKEYFSSFEIFVNRLYELYKMDKFKSFIHKEKSHYIPQYKYIYDRNGNMLVNYVAYFDNFEEEIENILSFLSKKKLLTKFKHKKMSSTHSHYYEYYTPELEDKIYEIYKKDFKLFDFPGCRI